MTIRTTAQRVADTRARLRTDEDLWLATASLEGTPHLIPLSLSWIEGRVICVTYTDSATARNIAATSRARCSLASTTDVVTMTADAEVMGMAAFDPGILQQMVDQFGWDPRESPEIDWSVLAMTPRTIHAWHMEPEIKGRTIMRHGEWLA